MKSACKDLLKKVPQANSASFFEADGECWGTMLGLARILSVSQSAIRTRIASCRSRDGMTASGRLYAFYALSDVKKSCADLLRKKRRRTTKR